MMELSDAQLEHVSGGWTVGGAFNIVSSGYKGACAYVSAISAVGATLSNYYGEEMTIQIIAAGNMTA